MKRFILTVIIGITSVISNSQNLLKPTWKFKTGDDVSWARIEQDDRDWKNISSGSMWENQGFQDYDGFAWYRMSIVIPSSFKSEAEKMGGFALKLGAIDDVDYTYFNGQLIGKTGEIPPNLKTEYQIERNYSIPFTSILWDKENVIAVRVYDNTGGGGIYSSDLYFGVKGMRDNIILNPIINSSNHIFEKGKLPSGSLNINILKIKSTNAILKTIITSDFMDTICNLSQNILLKGGKQISVPIKFPTLKPGFYKIHFSIETPLGNKVNEVSIGIEPEKIISPIDARPDFNNYWQRAKTELAAVDPQFRLIKQDSLSVGNRNVYIVEMRSLGNVLVRGWYAVPKKTGKYPAILHVQGYSSFNTLEWAYQGDDIIVFSLNIRGHGFSKDNVNPGFPGYLTHFIEDKEMYVYRGAYMDTRRAIDFLFSRPEVDQSKVAVEGGSQGGALSIATAALNNERISLCIPHVPFLSDFKDYFKIASWPYSDFSVFSNKNPKISWEKIYETLSYIDIKNLAPWVKCPILMGIGLVDDVCPPHINFAAYNQLNVPKEYLVYPFNGHGIPNEYHIYKFKWIKKQWGME